MFKVYENRTEIYENVYAVLDDANGYPKFLIRRDGKWIWRSAKHYIPVDESIEPDGYEEDW